MHVVLVEFDSFANEPIQIRRANRSTMPTDVVPAQIVGHDEQNVREGAARTVDRTTLKVTHNKSTEIQADRIKRAMAILPGHRNSTWT